MYTSRFSRSARTLLAAIVLVLVILAVQFAFIPSSAIVGSPTTVSACEPSMGTC